MKTCARTLLAWGAIALAAASPGAATDGEPGAGDTLPVAVTNLAVSPAFADIGDPAMHGFLLGLPDDRGRPRYVSEILAHPDAAWIIDVPVPAQPSLYGPASGGSLPLAAFIAYPAATAGPATRYAFPYQDAQNGAFENMLDPGEAPRFADSATRYPLIVYAHGMSAHGIYDVGHAQALASQGYIVAVPFYGDDRTANGDSSSPHLGFLRPLLTRALIDSLLESDSFGPHIDGEAIGLSGHSFGGFTALALAGGRYLDNPATARDPRLTAAVIAAPWVGGRYDGEDIYAFGPGNRALNEVDTPVLTLFGTIDEDTTAEFILPATRQLGGPSYVVELVGQPHIFAQGSWQGRDNWERLFFAAYLKRDSGALQALKTTHSMAGGGEDLQHFHLQKTDR